MLSLLKFALRLLKFDKSDKLPLELEFEFDPIFVIELRLELLIGLKLELLFVLKLEELLLELFHAIELR